MLSFASRARSEGLQMRFGRGGRHSTISGTDGFRCRFREGGLLASDTSSWTDGT